MFVPRSLKRKLTLFSSSSPLCPLLDPSLLSPPELTSTLRQRERSLTDLSVSSSSLASPAAPAGISGDEHFLFDEEAVDDVNRPPRFRHERHLSLSSQLEADDDGDGGGEGSCCDLEEIECLLPNGIVIDVLVHPDDEMYHIKQVVLSRATTDGE